MAWKVRKGDDGEARSGEAGADQSLHICSAITGSGGPLQPSSVHQLRPGPRTCLRVKSQTPPTPFPQVLARANALRDAYQPPEAPNLRRRRRHDGRGLQLAPVRGPPGRRRGNYAHMMSSGSF